MHGTSTHPSVSRFGVSRCTQGVSSFSSSRVALLPALTAMLLVPAAAPNPPTDHYLAPRA